MAVLKWVGKLPESRKARDNHIDFHIKEFCASLEAYNRLSNGLPIDCKKWDKLRHTLKQDSPNRIVLQILRSDIHFIYHMTHIDNLSSIFKYDLLPHGNKYQSENISDPNVQSIRENKYKTIYNKSLHRYVPFYFNPRNAMLYPQKQGRDPNIIILAYELDLLDQFAIVYTDRNAAANNALFFGAAERFVQKIDFERVFLKSWHDLETGIVDQDLKQVMMAEVLIPSVVNIQSLARIYCINDEVKKKLLSMCKNIEVSVDKNLFF